VDGAARADVPAAHRGGRARLPAAPRPQAVRFRRNLHRGGAQSPPGLAHRRRDARDLHPRRHPLAAPPYQLNGAVYAFRADLLAGEARSLLVGRTGAVLMPDSRSQDIDTLVDFTVAESLLTHSQP